MPNFASLCIKRHSCLHIDQIKFCLVDNYIRKFQIEPRGICQPERRNIDECSPPDLQAATSERIPVPFLINVGSINEGAPLLKRERHAGGVCTPRPAARRFVSAFHLLVCWFGVMNCVCSKNTHATPSLPLALMNTYNYAGTIAADDDDDGRRNPRLIGGRRC